MKGGWGDIYYLVRLTNWIELERITDEENLILSPSLTPEQAKNFNRSQSMSLENCSTPPGVTPKKLGFFLDRYAKKSELKDGFKYQGRGSGSFSSSSD